MTRHPAVLRLPDGRAARWVAFGLVALLCATELGVVELAGAASSAALSNAVALDLTLVATLVVWYFGVRRGGLPPLILLPTYLAGLALSHRLVGAAEPVALDVLEAGAVAAEVGVLVALLVGIGRASRALGGAAGDPLTLIGGLVRKRLGDGLAARIIAAELATLWFATLAWLRPPPAYGGARAFGYGRRAAGIHGALVLVSLVEVVGAHVLLSRWSVAAAWVATALAAYGVLWILADWRAVRLRPTTLEGGVLRVRTGIRWTVDVPLGRIASAGRRDWRQRFGSAPGSLNLAVIGEPDVVVELDAPVVARGPLGIRRSGRRLGLSADDPAALVAALAGPANQPR